MSRMAEPLDDVFDHDDRAIDDDAEVDRPEAEQRCRRCRPHHMPQKPKSIDKRNRDGTDQPGPQIAQKDIEQQYDQRRPFEQVVLDRGDDAVDQFRAVVGGIDAHIVGQRLAGLRRIPSRIRRVTS